MKSDNKDYKYRPVLFFALAYLFTWIFWIPAIFVSENFGAVLMLIGLLAPAVVSTVFVLASGSPSLKRDLKLKLIGFYKVKWLNVLFAIFVFAGIVAASILLSLLFGQSLNQFSFTSDFSFTGVGIAGAFVSVTVAAIIEEVGWKGYCEDSIGQYMNWFWESMIFGLLWGMWHLPLIFIKIDRGDLLNVVVIVHMEFAEHFLRLIDQIRIDLLGKIRLLIEWLKRFQDIFFCIHKVDDQRITLIRMCPIQAG